MGKPLCKIPIFWTLQNWHFYRPKKLLFFQDHSLTIFQGQFYSKTNKKKFWIFWPKLWVNPLENTHFLDFTKLTFLSSWKVSFLSRLELNIICRLIVLKNKLAKILDFLTETMRERLCKKPIFLTLQNWHFYCSERLCFSLDQSLKLFLSLFFFLKKTIEKILDFLTENTFPLENTHFFRTLQSLHFIIIKSFFSF